MSEIDIDFIRFRAESTPAGVPYVRRAEVIALCDALDAARAEIVRLKAAEVALRYLADDAEAKAERRAEKAEARVAAVRVHVDGCPDCYTDSGLLAALDTP